MGALPGEYGGDFYGGGYYGGSPVPPNPYPRVFIRFDMDALAPGIVQGDNATLASLGDWTAGADTDLTWSDAASRAYAGLGCAQLTATATADISATLPDQGPVERDRTYLIWVHTRPEDTARTARLTATWKSATGITLLSRSAERDQILGEHIRVGIAATAPPGTGLVDITVTILGAANGEIHYVDTVTCDDVGTEVTDHVLSGSAGLGGRNHELARTDAGEASIVLSNELGWYTPGAETDIDGDPIPAPYLGNIVPRRRLWIVAEFDGVLDAVWSGHARGWKQTIPAGIAAASEVTVAAVDPSRVLSGIDVPPPYRAEVLSDGPLSLFPLDEPSSSGYAGDLVFGAPAPILSSPTGSGDSAFGASTVLPVTLTGRNTDGGSTSLGLNLADTIGDMGSVLDLRFAGGGPPQIHLAPWTCEFWFAYDSASPPGLDQILLRHIVEAPPNELLSGFQILLTTTGAVQVQTGAGETAATSSAGHTDGAGHHVVLVYEDDGSAHGLVTLYLDGAEADSSQLVSDPMPWGFPSLIQMGGAYSASTGAVTFWATARFQHVAFYYKRLSALRIAAHYTAGSDGFYQETDADRIAAILRFAGWPDADTAIDAGLTPLMPRDWSGTNVLALIEDTCGYSGATSVMDATGKVRILNRHRTVNEVRIVATFRESDKTEAEADGFQASIDDTGIVNVYEVAQIGGGTIQVTDDASIARYGRIKGDAIPLGAASNSESVNHARWLLSRTAEPLVRIETASWVPPAGDGELWPLILPRAFLDRINVAELPATAPVDPLDVLIGRVSHAWATGVDWVTTYQLEPALIDEMGVCDHPVYGIADDPLCIAGY